MRHKNLYNFILLPNFTCNSCVDISHLSGSEVGGGVLAVPHCWLTSAPGHSAECQTGQSDPGPASHSTYCLTGQPGSGPAGHLTEC